MSGDYMGKLEGGTTPLGAVSSIFLQRRSYKWGPVSQMWTLDRDRPSLLQLKSTVDDDGVPTWVSQVVNFYKII